MDVKFQGSTTLGALADCVGASLPESVRSIEILFETGAPGYMRLFDAGHHGFGSASRLLMETLLGVEVGEAIRLAIIKELSAVVEVTR